MNERNRENFVLNEAKNAGDALPYSYRHSEAFQRSAGENLPIVAI